MAVRRLSTPKYLHLIYDTAYETDPGSIEHLPDLRVPLQELGYVVREYFVSPDNVTQKTKGIPTDSRDHIVFLHVDMPPKVPVGTPIEAVRSVANNHHPSSQSLGILMLIFDSKKQVFGVPVQIRHRLPQPLLREHRLEISDEPAVRRPWRAARRISAGGGTKSSFPLFIFG